MAGTAEALQRLSSVGVLWYMKLLSSYHHKLLYLIWVICKVFKVSLILTNYFLKCISPVSARLSWKANASFSICGVWVGPQLASALS